MSAAVRKVGHDAVTERCQSLKLVHAAEGLAELVEEASCEDLSPVKFLDRVDKLCGQQGSGPRRLHQGLAVGFIRCVVVGVPLL